MIVNFIVIFKIGIIFYLNKNNMQTYYGCYTYLMM